LPTSAEKLEFLNKDSIMANGKEPKTTGEHIIALYGHITGLKRDLKELREESSQMHKNLKENLIILLGGSLED
jgi:hypothetical protein